jgi:uncharacterized phiE125 gp8 family phage protein
MSLVIVEYPAPIITIEQVKRQLGLRHDDDTAFISSLIAAATSYADGWNGYLGRALGLQTWDLKLGGDEYFYGPNKSNYWEWRGGSYGIFLPLPPVVSVTSITYLDADRVDGTFDPENYYLTGVGATTGAFVSLAGGASWPAVFDGPEALTVRFVSGYSRVPEGIIQGLLLLIGHWYNNRESVISGTIAEELPLTTKALLDPWRVMSL